MGIIQREEALPFLLIQLNFKYMNGNIPVEPIGHRLLRTVYKTIRSLGIFGTIIFSLVILGSFFKENQQVSENLLFLIISVGMTFGGQVLLSQHD